MEVVLHSISHEKQLFSSLANLYELKLDYLYDINILIENEDATSNASACAKVIPAHKIILAASSKWFHHLTLTGTLNCEELLVHGKKCIHVNISMFLYIQFMQ